MTEETTPPPVLLQRTVIQLLLQCDDGLTGSALLERVPWATWSSLNHAIDVLTREFPLLYQADPDVGNGQKRGARYVIDRERLGEWIWTRMNAAHS